MDESEILNSDGTVLIERGNAERESNLIVIAICALTSLVRLEWSLEFWAQYKPFSRKFHITAIANVSPVAAARNLALHKANEMGAKYCLFYDDDIIPHRRDAMAQLISAMDQLPEATLIGSVCPIRATVPEPIVIKRLGEGPWFGWQDGDIHQIYHSGTGFLLIRMKDLEDLDVPTVKVEEIEVRQFFQQYEQVGDYLGTDDYYFAGLMAQNGKRWLVHGGVICDQMDRDGTRYQIVDSLIAR